METWTTTAEQSLQQLEANRDSLYSAQLYTHLHVEVLEDSSRCNNIRVRGLPEATPASQHRGTIQGILSLLLMNTLQDDVEIG